MKKSVKIIIGVLIAITLYFSGWGIPKTIENLKDKKLAVQDSISELNRIIEFKTARYTDSLAAERNRYWSTIHFLDSISKVGGSLSFTNTNKEECVIKVTKK
jgi:hypothetical protein